MFAMEISSGDDNVSAVVVVTEVSIWGRIGSSEPDPLETISSVRERVGDSQSALVTLSVSSASSTAVNQSSNETLNMESAIVECSLVSEIVFVNVDDWPSDGTTKTVTITHPWDENFLASVEAVSSSIIEVIVSLARTTTVHRSNNDSSEVIDGSAGLVNTTFDGIEWARDHHPGMTACQTEKWQEKEEIECSLHP
jgi:hypothetical protein